MIHVSKERFAFFTVWTGLKPLVLQMISRAYIKLAMDSLKDETRAHQVLIMAEEGEEVPPEVEALRRSGREFLKNCLIPNKDIDGKNHKSNREMLMLK